MNVGFLWSERLKGRNRIIGASAITHSKAFLRDGDQINIKLSSHSILSIKNSTLRNEQLKD